MLAAVAILATVAPILTSPMDHMQKAFLLSEVNPYFAGLKDYTIWGVYFKPQKRKKITSTKLETVVNIYLEWEKTHNKLPF